MYRYGPRGNHARSRSARSSSYWPGTSSVGHGHHHLHDLHGRRAHHLNYGSQPQPCQHRSTDYRNVTKLDDQSASQEPRSRTVRLQYQRYQEPHSEADPHCQICSYTQPYPAPQKPVSHTHFSSVRLRELTGVEGTESTYLCPSCKSSHVAYPEERIKLVISDFTLHRFFTLSSHTSAQYPGDMVHVDYITIPEGCLADLVHAFRLDYELPKQQKPLDVVVVAGYNDLLKNNSREFIMEGYGQLSELVKGLGKDNTLAVATLVYPPSLCWFPDNGVLPRNYRNRLEKINT